MAVLFDLATLTPVERSVVVARTDLPYIPGLLAFRKGPHMAEAVRRLSRQPDLLIVDGQGIAHPKRFGLACHLGEELGIPAIGCAKSRLVGTYDEPAAERGSRTPLVDRNDTVGAVLRTRSGVRPVFISPGHLITIDEAVAMCSGPRPASVSPNPSGRQTALRPRTSGGSCPGKGKKLPATAGGVMKQRPRKPAVPRPAGETLRRAISELILDQPLSAREISVQAHIAEKDVYGHLEHIRHSLHAAGSHLVVTPAECRSCGFEFSKRDRLAPPGKCPICRSETIFEPLFAIRMKKMHDA